MSDDTDRLRPGRHKMAMLTFLGLLLPVHVIPPRVQGLLPDHRLLASVISVALLVGLMSYVVLPLMTRVARDWLQPDTSGEQNDRGRHRHGIGRARLRPGGR